MVLGSRYSFFFRPIADFVVAPLLALQFFIWKPIRLIQYLSLPTPQLQPYGPGLREVLHVFELPGQSREKSSPSDCCVFVHGGAWGSGFPRLYYSAAIGVSKSWGNTSHAILVEYPTHPDADILQQVDSLKRALSTIRRDFKEGNIILVSHSSGANIATLALLAAGKEMKQDVTAFVALAGVFDIKSQFKREKERGVEQLSPMAAAAGGDESRWEQCSPTHLVQTWSCSAAPVSSFMPPTLLLHGTSDSTVPISSSQEFGAALRDAGVVAGGLSEVYIEKIGHADPVYALMESSSPHCRVVSAIKAFAATL